MAIQAHASPLRTLASMSKATFHPKIESKPTLLPRKPIWRLRRCLLPGVNGMRNSPREEEIVHDGARQDTGICTTICAFPPRYLTTSQIGMKMKPSCRLRTSVNYSRDQNEGRKYMSPPLAPEESPGWASIDAFRGSGAVTWLRQQDPRTLVTTQSAQDGVLDKIETSVAISNFLCILTSSFSAGVNCCASAIASCPETSQLNKCSLHKSLKQISICIVAKALSIQRLIASRLEITAF
jgi:hypothetical protein